MGLIALRHILKRLLPTPMITQLSQYEYFRKITGVGFFGLKKLDRRIVKYLPKRNGYYVELGANDGITQSNTFHFEKYKGYNGILIEPIPLKFEECKKNRSDKNYFANCACVSFDYREKSVTLLYSNLMTTSLDGSSDIKDRQRHASSGAHLIKENVYEFEIEAKTLNSILLESNAPKVIDFLSLDVEGGELEVLKGIDFGMYTISAICIESRDVKRISNFLFAKNYILQKKLSVHDYLFLLK